MGLLEVRQQIDKSEISQDLKIQLLNLSDEQLLNLVKAVTDGFNEILKAVVKTGETLGLALESEVIRLRMERNKILANKN